MPDIYQIRFMYRKSCLSGNNPWNYVTMTGTPYLLDQQTVSTYVTRGCYEFGYSYVKCSNGYYANQKVYCAIPQDLNCTSARFRGGAGGEEDSLSVSITDSTLFSSCGEAGKVTVTSHNDYANITWKPVIGATGYRIIWKDSTLFSNDSVSNFYNQALVFDQDSSYTLYGLDPCKTYELAVITICSDTLESLWRYSTFFKANSSCDAPTFVTSVNVLDESAKIVWGSVLGANEYKVRYRQIGLGAGGSWTEISSPINEAEILGLIPNSDYEVEVRTLCCNGDSSAYSVRDTFHTLTIACHSPLVIDIITGVESATILWNSVPTATFYSISWHDVDSLTTFTNNVEASDTSFILTGLDPCKEYAVSVVSICNDTLASLITNENIVSTRTCSSPESTYTYDLYTTSVKVAWNEVEKATTYEFIYRREGEVNWDTLTVINPNVHLTTLIGNSIYEYQVRSLCCGDVWSKYSVIDTFYTPYDDCGTPIIQTIVPQTNEATISWKSVPSASAYRISWKPVGNDTTIIVEDILAMDTTTTISGLNPCIDYVVHIETICDSIGSSPSNDEIVKPNACGSIPAPYIFAVHTNDIQLSWNGTLYELGYEVRYRQVGQNVWQSLNIDTNFVSIQGLQANTTYEYEVRAICCVGDTSAYSTTDTITLPEFNCQAPSRVGILNSPEFDNVYVYWERVPAVQGYEITWYADTLNAPRFTTFKNVNEYNSLVIYPESKCINYKVELTAICTNGDRTTTVDTIFNKRKCTPISFLSAVNITFNSAQLIWDQIEGSTNYIVRYKANSIFDSVWTVANSIGNTYAMDSLKSSTVYDVEVSSVNCFGDTCSSKLYSFITRIDCKRPTTHIFVENNGIRVNWSTYYVANTYFVSWQADTLNAPIFQVGVNSPDTTYLIQNLNPCVSYKVRLDNLCSLSEYPEETYVTLPSVSCVNPTFVTVSNVTYSSSKVSWQNVTGATNYIVSYRLKNTNIWNSLSTQSDSIVLNSLAQFSEYEVKVASICCNGDTSNFSSVTNFKTRGCLDVVNLRLSNITTGSIFVSWDRFEFANGYHLQYRRIGVNNWQNVNQIQEPYYDVTGLDPNTQYEFRVRTICDIGFSNWSTKDTTTTDVCNAPTNVLVTSVTTSSFALTWDVQQNAVSYDIHYRVIGVNGWRNIRNIVANTHNITGLQQDTDYEFQVLTNCTGGGNSDWSVMDTVMTCTCGIPLTPTFSDIAATNLKVTWRRVHNATTYGLRYRRVGVNSWTTINNLVDTTRTISNLLPNTLYEFSLRSVCGSTHSIWTVPVQVRTLECLTPTNAQESNISLYGFRYNWDAVPNAVSYRLRYKAIGANNWHTVSNINTLYRDITNLNTQTMYEVQVQTDCGNQNSGWSNLDTVTTLSCGIPTNTFESNVLVNSFTYNWNSVPNAVSYRVRYRAIGVNNWQTVSNINTLYRNLTNLNPQTSYEIQTQTDCGSENSGWSNLDTVTTILCESPINIIASSVTNSGFTLSWNNVIGATEYQVRYKRSNQNNWQTISNILLNSRQLTGLQSTTNYLYEVRSNCNGDWSAWSSTQNVTTLGIRQSGETIVEQLKIQLYPNPSKGVFNLQIESAEIRDLKVTIFDVAGRLIFENNITLREGLNEYPYNITGISSGMYFLEVGEGDTMKRIKLVIE